MDVDRIVSEFIRQQLHVSFRDFWSYSELVCWTLNEIEMSAEWGPQRLVIGWRNARYFQFLLLAPRELKSLTCWMFPWDGVKVWDGVLWGVCVWMFLWEKVLGVVVFFFEDRKEICEIVLFISPHFCLCLSVCLSYPVGSNWIDMCQLSRLQSLESRVPNPVVKQRHARQMVPLCILLKVFCVIVCVPR